MTKIEESAYNGWDFFRSIMIEIWNQYEKYGKKSLRINLVESGNEQFVSLFTEAKKSKFDFEELIRKYWENNYHFVAKSFKELVGILEIYRKNGGTGALKLLPETGPYFEGDFYRGCNQTYSVTKNVYLEAADLVENKLRKTIQLIDYTNKKVYEISFSKYPFYNTYLALQISENNDVIEI